MRVVRREPVTEAFQWNNQPQDELPGWMVKVTDRVSNFNGRWYHTDGGYAEPHDWLVYDGGHVDIYTDEEFNTLFKEAPDGG